MRLKSLIAIIDFFLPMEVLSSVLVVFALENLLNIGLAELAMTGGGMWIFVYLIGLLLVSALNYASADEDEREDLVEDIESL